MTKTKNFYLNEHTFVSFFAFSDTLGHFVIPTMIFDTNLPLSSEVEISRLSICFWKWRAGVNFGKVKDKRKYSWKRSHLTDFLHWYREENTGPALTKERLEKYILNNEGLLKFFRYNSCKHYYTKRIFLKQLKKSGA